MKKLLEKIKNYINPIEERGKKKSPVFIGLVVLATAAMLISNVIATKTFSLFGWSVGGYELTLPCAVIVFPITYILSDIFSEVYGYVWSRRTCYIAFLMNLLMVAFFQLAILIPGSDPSLGESFKSVLGATPLTLVAGLVAWVIGDLANDLIFKKLKQKAQEKSDNKIISFMFRATSSSLVGEILDSSIFIPILYVNLLISFNVPYPPFYAILVMILTQALVKTLFEIVVSPLTALMAKGLVKYEQKLELN